MSRTALLFAGQGSQYVGMGKEIHSSYEKTKIVFDKASDITNVDIKQLCFDGPEEKLNQTINTQICVFTYNMAVFSIIKDVKADFVAGHSLGEVCAAVASDTLEFEEGLRLVNKRAQFMQKAAESKDGSMIAVIGLRAEEISQILKTTKGVYLSNFNSPMQTTVSGSQGGLEKAKQLLDGKAKRVIDLPVSGAFHSPYMEIAAKSFSEHLNNVRFNNTTVPLIANFDARIKKNSKEIQEALSKQISAPVRFVEMLNLLKEKDVTKFIEIGPGKVLTNLTKRTLKDIDNFSTESVDSIETTLNNFINTDRFVNC